MEPHEKQQCWDILQSHNGEYSVACVRELHQVMHIPVKDMQNLRVCLDLAQEHPEHLQRIAGGAVPAEPQEPSKPRSSFSSGIAG